MSTTPRYTPVTRPYDDAFDALEITEFLNRAWVHGVAEFVTHADFIQYRIECRIILASEQSVFSAYRGLGKCVAQLLGKISAIDVSTQRQDGKPLGFHSSGEKLPRPDVEGRGRVTQTGPPKQLVWMG